MNPFCFLFLFLVTTCVYALPSSVIVVRHAEKTRGPHLTEQGWDRAAAFVSYFGAAPCFSVTPEFQQASTSPPFSPPFALHTTRPSSSEVTNHPIETMTPLANALGYPIHQLFTKEHLADFATLLLTTTRYQGKQLLVCCEHGVLPGFVNLLITQAGGTLLNLADYPSSRYDLVYFIDYTGHPPTFTTPYTCVSAGGNVSLTVTIQELMFDDENVLPPSPFPLK